jgi:hypothetical protein
VQNIFNNCLNLRSEIRALKIYLLFIDAQYLRRLGNV